MILGLVVVILYTISVVRKTKYNNVILHDNMIALDNRNMVPYVVPAERMTSLVALGQEFSYSFWIFLSGSYVITSGYKVLFQRGNTEVLGYVSPSTSPLVAMDPSTNRMYVAVSTTSVSASMPLENVFSRPSGKFDSGFLVSYIDYVPLQRWVNVAVVVKDKNMFTYVDGDIYSVVSTGDIPVGDRPMIRGTTDDLTIGDRRNATPGYVSLTQFFNYALSQRDAKAVYNRGPSKSSWLTLIGFGNYGVRNPVYKVAD
ncbi:hypothetical protein FOA52_004181 [Chlamydomonas sp. UWO 241]|nr:hypothetical protein FOA52_004181 [Chlamydomonas sp. UWO 241]